MTGSFEVEVIAKPKVLARIRQLLMVPLGFCLFGFAALIGTKAFMDLGEIGDLSFAVCLGILLLASLGLLCLMAGFDSIYKLAINTASRTLEVWRCDGTKTTYQSDELAGSKGFIMVTKYGKYKACFIETLKGAQLPFSELDFVNFQSVVKSVGSVAPNSFKLKRRHSIVTSGRAVKLAVALACAAEVLAIIALTK
jgi:hypothetical protein